MKNAAKLFIVVLMLSSVAFGATILHYDFEDGTPGVPMNDFPVTQQNGTVGTADLSGNDYHMHAWDDYWGPLFSDEGDTPTGTGLSSVHQSHNDGYTLADGIRRWSPGTWTIELSFKLNDIAGWRTLIGRDDWTGIDGDIGPSLQVQNNGIDDTMRVAFVTVSGEHYELFSSLVPEPGKWYHLAVVTDGDRLDMYADRFDGNGFQNIGTLIMAAGIDHSLLATGNWTFGRGWYNGNFVDHIDGNMDNIRFSDEALTTDQLIPATLLATKKQAHNPQPANRAAGIPLDQALSWTTGLDPNDPNVPNPAITGHNLWLSIAYDPLNPPDAPNWQDPRVQVIQIPADTNPADGNVDPNVSYSPTGLQRDALYYWIVDESLGAENTEDWENIIVGALWSFETVTSAPEVDAGSSILTWLKEGTTTVDLSGTVTDATGDVTATTWSVISSPPDTTVDITDVSATATTATLTATGLYALELHAVDAALNEGSDYMEIEVYEDSCKAAQNHPDGYTPSPYDFNFDCKVDFLDLAMLAAAWLEDASLTEDVLYDPN
ncbi:MAG: LamG-like jellyroll fold domain-containing protein [Planctomycetota bacterium]|jgi:hypothetical protein